MGREIEILALPPPSADARLRHGPDPSHVGDLRLPPGAGLHAVALVIHGGYWRAAYDLAYMGHACAALTAAGLATWNVEYRRIGQAGSGCPGTFRDVARAADYLRDLAPRHNLDLARVVAVGHSAGGHLALWLAGRARIPADDPLYDPSPLPLHGVVALAGVADLRRAWELRLSDNIVETFLGGTPDTVAERYAVASPAALLPLGVPQILVHGTADESVPYAISRDYHAVALAGGDAATLVTLPSAGHFELVDPRMPEWVLVRQAVLSLASSTIDTVTDGTGAMMTGDTGAGL